MANRYLTRRSNKTSNTEMDDTVWKELFPELVEKIMCHLPVLTIASTLREVSKTWRDFPDSVPFMHLWKDINNSSFGFLMHGTNILNYQCETMAFDHETLKWQMAPSFQLEGPHRTCKAESVSEGILCLSPHPTTSPTSKSFIVWNPLLPPNCKQIVPCIPQDYWTVNLVVDRENASFKILAFTSWFRECHIYSSTTRSWLFPIANYKGPDIYDGLSFPTHREGGHVVVSYKNCIYVAVASSINDVHKVGDLCYNVKKNVWKTLVICTLSPEIMKLYGYCFTRSLFVISDMMYKVVEYVGGVHLLGNDRPCATVQILARTLALAKNAGNWTVIATTVLPQSDWEMKQFGTWYGCILKGHAQPTICGLFKSEPNLFMMMYNIGSNTWKTVCIQDKATSVVDGSQEPVGIMVQTRGSWKCHWTVNRCKWLSMRMVPHYKPSWICPAAGSNECKHNEISGLI